MSAAGRNETTGTRVGRGNSPLADYFYYTVSLIYYNRRSKCSSTTDRVRSSGSCVHSDRWVTNVVGKDHRYLVEGEGLEPSKPALSEPEMPFPATFHLRAKSGDFVVRLVGLPGHT